MKYLRIFIIIYILLIIVGGIILVLPSKNTSYALIAVYFAVGAIILVIGTFFEKRYESKTISKRGGWQTTGEKFIDNATGKTMEVYYNSKTGERSYQEVKEVDETTKQTK